MNKEKKEIRETTEWDAIREGITKGVKRAKEMWGFECLKDACNLKWDIGAEVYFTSNDEVFKGNVISVNSYGMHKILVDNQRRTYEPTFVFVPTAELFENVYYALMEAKSHRTPEDKMINEGETI